MDELEKSAYEFMNSTTETVEWLRKRLDESFELNKHLNKMLDQKSNVIKELDGCLGWYIDVVKRYEKTLKKIIEDVGEPYTRIIETLLEPNKANIDVTGYNCPDCGQACFEWLVDKYSCIDSIKRVKK